MKKYLKYLLLSLPVVLLIVLFSFNCYSNASEEALRKSLDESLNEYAEVLDYLLNTVTPEIECEARKMQEELNLTDEQILEMKELSTKLHYDISAAYYNFLRKHTDPDENVRATADIDLCYDFIENYIAEYVKDLKEYLGEKKYYEVLKWTFEWLPREYKSRKEREERRRKELEEEENRADVDRISGILATHYVPNNPDSEEVALPDKYIKFANRGWKNDIPKDLREIYGNPPYRVNIYCPKTGKSALNVLVNEVGPWNENDNYWYKKYGRSPRRGIFANLRLGLPGSKAAREEGFNGGKSEFGRKVTNNAGIDLSPKVSKKLGLSMQENENVDIRFVELP